MKNHSNTYIFIYSAVMVIVVAALLSFVSMTLKPIQDKNVEIEKKKNILSSIKIESTAENAEELYEKYISASYLISVDGEAKESAKDKNGAEIIAFDIDLKKEYAKDKNDQNLPIFEATSDGATYYIIPVRGKGLWGPIWGYIALESDLNTVYGATFDHKSETPGLGAEINTTPFEQQFIGKKILNEENEFVSVNVIKGGAAPNDNHGVDGITGGTITSNALDQMLKDCIGSYAPYIKKHKNN